MRIATHYGPRPDWSGLRSESHAMIDRRGRIAGIVVAVGTACAGLARGDNLPPIAAGFRAHVVNQKGGGIDWTTGELIVEGVGKLRGNRPGDRLGAQRAASLVAARNALAIANGIQIDARGRVENMRSGRISLDGVVKGQRVVDTTWDNTRNPVECHVKLRVPLWGLTGICTVFSDSQRRVALQQGGRRLQLANVHADVTESVLIIDARGRKPDLCLFPVVRSADGAVLYDIATRTDPQTRSDPPVRYVETDIIFEKLRASLDGPARTAVLGMQALSVHGSVLPMFLYGENPSSQPTTGPASQPTSRPGRRRVVVKAAHPIPGQANSQIVLTKEDAEKLRQSPEGASLLRNGKVIVVVDSAAAGIQGCRPHDDESTLLAQSAQ
jgi:hypothetical protein